MTELAVTARQRTARAAPAGLYHPLNGGLFLVYVRGALQAAGVAGLVLALILAYQMLRAILRAYKAPGLAATAGGLSMILRSPSVQILLLVLFALAFYVFLRGNL
jgi:hypothetical protein